jgi:dolichyl-phosphate-mannose-protein mannosyltransferase
LLDSSGGSSGAASWGSAASRLAKAAVLLSVVTLAALLVRQQSPSSLSTLAVQAGALGSVLTAVGALGVGLVRFDSSNSQLRRALLILLLLTSAVFVAHIYVINSPATTSPSSASGGANSSFSNDEVSVSSTLAHGQLTVDILDKGSKSGACDPGYCAIDYVHVLYNGTALPDSGLSSPPTALSPLLPRPVAREWGGQYTVNGSWDLGTGGAGTVAVQYDDLTCYHLPDSGNTVPSYGCVMDEPYYLGAAQDMLTGAPCAPGADGCNLEHPPLAKALIAAGMAAFGANDFGWRIAVVLTGTLSIPLLFAIVYFVSKSTRLSLFAALLFSVDNLYFVHSSIAVIDVPSVFFAMAALAVYLSGAKLWNADRFVLAGTLMGLSLLSKETAVFLLGALVTYHLYVSRSPRRARALQILKMLLAAGLVSVVGLQMYAFSFTSASSPYFYQLVQYMLKYGAGLTGPGWTGGLGGGYITPLDWLTFYTPVSYLVTSSGSVVDVGYWGTNNLIIVWMLFAWVPFVLYRAYRGGAVDAAEEAEDAAGILALIWFFWAYFPYIFLWIYGRVTYPFYLVPALPALSLGAAYFVTRRWFSGLVAAVYVVAAFGWFFLYFPVKDFLPMWVRALLRR